ncbi:hypothetical protein FJ938_27550, partial [Mesorhizobium sp. B2-4-14]
ENRYPCNRSILLPIYPVRTPAPSPRIGTGRRDLSAASAISLEIGEILGDGVLLPVPIRGEVPGRAMRGGADFGDHRHRETSPITLPSSRRQRAAWPPPGRSC